jgi:VCBS repeat-containing protein
MKPKKQPLVWLSTAPLALAACGSSEPDEVSLLDLNDSYALAMRGNGTTISSGALGLDAGLSVALVSSPSNGAAAQNQDGTVSYTPDTGYTGNDEVQVEISDANGNSQIVTIKLDIGGAGGDPIAADDKFRVAEDGQFSIIAKYGVLANDFDETDLSAALLSGPGNGSVTLNADGSYTYTPAPDFNGQDSFTYTVTDEDGDTDTGTVNILVTPVNDAPVAADYFASGTNWDEVATGQVQAIDVDGDTLTFTLDQVPANGSVTMYSDGSFEYTPDPLFFGTDTFTYTVSDGNGGTDTATVTVEIAPAIDLIFGFRIDGKNAFDFLGSHLAALGDVNGDGIDDFAISSDLTDPLGRTNAGEVYVIYGSSSDFDRVFDLTTLDGTNGFTVYGGSMTAWGR